MTQPPLEEQPIDGTQHGVTAEELEAFLEKRDALLIDRISTMVDDRLKPVFAALEQRTTQAQVDQQIQTALEPIQAFTKELTGTIDRFKEVVGGQIQLFINKQEIFNAGTEQAVKVLSGQRDAQMEALRQKDADIQCDHAALTERFDVLSASHNAAALRLNMVYDDVRGGEGRESLNEMLSMLIKTTIPALEKSHAATVNELRTEMNRRIDDLTSAMNAMCQDVDRDHQFIETLRKALSWKTAGAVVKTGAKTFAGLPIVAKIASGVVIASLSAQAVAPDAVAAFLKWLESLFQ